MEVPGLTERSCDLGLQPPYLASRWDGFTYLPRYFPAFTFDDLGFPPLLKQEKPLRFILTPAIPRCYKNQEVDDL